MDAVAVNGASRVNDRGPDERPARVEGEAVEDCSESLGAASFTRP